MFLMSLHCSNGGYRFPWLSNGNIRNTKVNSHQVWHDSHIRSQSTPQFVTISCVLYCQQKVHHFIPCGAALMFHRLTRWLVHHCATACVLSVPAVGHRRTDHSFAERSFWPQWNPGNSHPQRSNNHLESSWYVLVISLWRKVKKCLPSKTIIYHTCFLLSVKLAFSCATL